MECYVGEVPGNKSGFKVRNYDAFFSFYSETLVTLEVRVLTALTFVMLKIDFDLIVLYHVSYGYLSTRGLVLIFAEC